MILQEEFQRRFDLFKNRSYLFFTLSGFMATIGIGFLRIATAWAAYEVFHSISGVALAELLTWLPIIILGPLYGYLADRYSQKILLIISDFVRGISIIVFVSIVPLGSGPYIFYLIPITTILGGVCMPAAIPFVARIMSKKDLSRANTTTDMVYEMGGLSAWD